jgi:NAD(P)H dehydrogenase (quinone)
MLNVDRSISPVAGDYRDSERVLGEAGVPFTVRRNGLYLERYTDHLCQYLEAGEITGAAGNGRISAASRQDYAAAAAAAILRTREGTGPTSSAARLSPCPNSRGLLARSQERK